MISEHAKFVPTIYNITNNITVGFLVTFPNPSGRFLVEAKY